MGVTPREVQDRSELSQEQRDVLVGTILGDASLAKHGRFHRLHVKHKLAHESLAMLKYDAFREFISMAPHRFDQRLRGKRYPCVQFATRTNPVFTMWHSHFYSGRRKMVPIDISRLLTPQAVAVWLMDDGAADYAGVTFQTHSFRREETDRLAAALRAEHGLRTLVRANRGSWIVYVTAESLPRLRDLVAPYLLPEFEYKLVPRRSRNPVETKR
jgi:LAGLIDADG DNA endonuclease family